MINFNNNGSTEHWVKSAFLKIVLFLFLFSFFSFGHAQSTLKPFIKAVGAVSKLGRYDPLFTADVSLAGGVHFNDHFSLQIGVNNTRVGSQLNVLTLPVSPSYRILKSKYPVSPVISLDVGTQIWSNGNDRYVDGYYNFTTSNGSNYRYKTGLFFSKVKLLTDFKVSQYNLSLMVGPTFNLMYFKIEGKEIDWSNGTVYFVEYIDEQLGFGFELSLMYTFPMKKRQAKNSEVGD